MADASFLTVDKSKCSRDHFCVHTCPFGLVGTDADGYPMASADAEALCMNCGQCMAACPHGAFSLRAMPLDTCEKIRPDLRVSPEQVVQLLQTRRSIRRYKPTPAARSVLTQVLDAVRWAPTAKNVQPVEYLVIESPQEVKRLASMTAEWMRQSNVLPHLVGAWDKGIDGILRSAPHLVVAHAPTNGYTPVVDCTIALAYLDLAAHAYGLGGCWAGLFMMGIQACKPLEEALRMPAGHKACGAMMLGYPQSKYYLVPQRKAARVRWLG